jgi:hypothetical protein
MSKKETIVSLKTLISLDGTDTEICAKKIAELREEMAKNRDTSYVFKSTETQRIVLDDTTQEELRQKLKDLSNAIFR